MFVQPKSLEFSKQIIAIFWLSLVVTGCRLSNFHTELPGGYFLVRTDSQSTQIFNPNFSGHPYHKPGNALFDSKFELHDFTAFTYEMPGIAVPAEVLHVGYEKQYIFGKVVQAKPRPWPAGRKFNAPGYFILNTRIHQVHLGLDYSKFRKHLTNLNLSLQMVPAERVRPVTDKAKSKESGLVAAYAIRVNSKISPMIGDVKPAFIMMWLFLNLVSIFVSIVSALAAVNEKGWARRLWLGGFVIATIYSIASNFVSDLAILFAIQALTVFLGITVLQRSTTSTGMLQFEHVDRAVVPRIRFSLIDACRFIALSSLILVLVKHQTRVLDIFVSLGFASIAVASWWCVCGNAPKKLRLKVFVLVCVLGSITMQMVQFVAPVWAMGCAVISVLHGIFLYRVFWFAENRWPVIMQPPVCK